MPASGRNADALRLTKSGTEVPSLRAAGTVPGVVVLQAAGANGPGQGRIRSSRLGTRLAWQPPGAATYGPETAVDGDGELLLEGPDLDEWVRVQVWEDFLNTSADEAADVDLEDVFETALSGDDVTAAEASAGDVSSWTVDLGNGGETTLRDLVVWIDAAVSGIEISDDGAVWVSPTTEAAGLSFAALAPGSTHTLYIRRTIGAGASANPSVLVHLHAAFRPDRPLRGTGAADLDAAADVEAAHGLAGTAGADLDAAAEATHANLLAGTGAADLDAAADAADPERISGTGAVDLDAAADVDRGPCYAEFRGRYRVFNAAAYRFYWDSSPPAEGDTPDETAASLPHTTTATFGDGTWYVAVSYFNGVIDSGFLAQGPRGETYRTVIVSGGAAVADPPTDPVDVRLENAGGGVVRIVALYYETGAGAAEEWAIAYTTNGSDPPADTPGITQSMSNTKPALLAYDLPTQSDGTTVKVRVQARRNDGTVGSPDWQYSAGYAIQTITADDSGPTAPEALAAMQNRS